MLDILKKIGEDHFFFNYNKEELSMSNHVTFSDFDKAYTNGTDTQTHQYLQIGKTCCGHDCYVVSSEKTKKIPFLELVYGLERDWTVKGKTIQTTDKVKYLNLIEYMGKQKERHINKNCLYNVFRKVFSQIGNLLTGYGFRTSSQIAEELAKKIKNSGTNEPKKEAQQA